MYYKHGETADGLHTSNTVTLSNVSTVVNYSDIGLIETRTKRLTLEGVLIASTQAALRTKIENLEDAYLNNTALESGLFHDDDTRSPHFLDGSKSISGIRVTDLSYPSGEGAEYATQRTFRISLETVEDASGSGGEGGSGSNSAFEESLSFTGGGWRLVAVETINGPPIIQQVAKQTAQIIVQSGSATRQNNYPTIPNSLFPDIENGALRKVALISPKLVGSQYRDWRATWSFTFVSATVDTTSEPNRPQTGR